MINAKILENNKNNYNLEFNLAWKVTCAGFTTQKELSNLKEFLELNLSNQISKMIEKYNKQTKGDYICQ